MHNALHGPNPSSFRQTEGNTSSRRTRPSGESNHLFLCVAGNYEVFALISFNHHNLFLFQVEVGEVVELAPVGANEIRFGGPVWTVMGAE